MGIKKESKDENNLDLLRYRHYGNKISCMLPPIASRVFQMPENLRMMLSAMIGALLNKIRYRVVSGRRIDSDIRAWTIR